MLYFIIGLVFAALLAVWEAAVNMEFFKEDIHNIEWWFTMAYCALVWPVIIIGFIIVKLKLD